MAAVAVVAVDDEDGVQWWQRGGCSMAAAAFDGSINGPRIGNVEAKMVIETISGGWRRQASAAFDGGNGRRWLLVFDNGGDGRLPWQWWRVDNRYGVQWWRWWRRSMTAVAFGSV